MLTLIYTLKSDQSMDNNVVSKIGVGMFTTNIYLQNSKSLAKTWTVNAGSSEYRRKTVRISNITFAILPFSH